MSDEYLLPCSCGKSVRVARSQAGQEVACACGKRLAVPTLRGLRELERASPEAGRRVEAAWSPTRGALFSGGLVVALLAIVFVSYQFWRYGEVASMTTDQSQTVVDMEVEMIDQMTPSDLLDLWHDIEEHGIGPRMVPIWVAAEEQAASHARQAIIGTAIGIAGALASLGAVFVGRKR